MKKKPVFIAFSTQKDSAEVCPAGLPLTAVAAVHREGIRSFFKRRT